LSGPSGNIQYHGNGYFEYIKNAIQMEKRFSKIGMIAGGTGIAPMFQLIQSITNSKLNEKKLGVSLIYGTRILADMAFLEDLANYDAKGKIAFFPVVEMPSTENWVYGTGLISPAMIVNLMPSPKGILFLEFLLNFIKIYFIF
jgi:NAD(P)H-flavin reductase